MSDSGWNAIEEHTAPVRSSIRARTETNRGESDPREEPSFEAWVSDLPQPHVHGDVTQAAASEGREYALTLHPTVRRGAKLARGLFLVATIALPLVVLLNVVQAGIAGHTLTTRGSSPQSLLMGRAVAPWLAGRRSASPVAGTLDIQPANMDGDVIYACWVDAPSGPYEPAPLHLAVSGDGAYTWRTLSSPVPRATACHLVPDAVDARHIALGAQTDAGAAAGCPTSRLFTSSDGGMHWSSVALPGLLARACVVFLSPATGTLVLWSYGTPASTGVPADARIWISLDSGATWHVASTGLPSGIVESVVSARADGALLVLMRRSEAGTWTATPAPATSELWSCPAGCPRWQRVALVPGSAPTVFATPNGWLSSGSGWGTLYAVGTVPGDASTEQTPDTPTTTTSVVAGPIYVSSGAHADTWHPLPPMPWSAAEIGMPAEFTGPSRIVGVAPDGALVLEAQNAGVVLEPATATQEQSAAGVLSMWDPRDGRWLSPALIEPAASTVLAVVWDEQGANGARRLTIWFDTRSGDVWPMVVPNSDWQVAQMAPRCQRCQ